MRVIWPTDGTAQVEPADIGKAIAKDSFQRLETTQKQFHFDDTMFFCETAFRDFSQLIWAKFNQRS